MYSCHKFRQDKDKKKIQFKIWEMSEKRELNWQLIEFESDKQLYSEEKEIICSNFNILFVYDFGISILGRYERGLFIE